MSTTGPFARQDGAEAAASLSEEARRAESSMRRTTAAHLAAIYTVAAGALWFAFGLVRLAPDHLAIYAGGVLVGLLVGHGLRPLIHDLLAQLQYRDRFLLFVPYAGILILPPSFGGQEMLAHSFGVLLILFSLQAVGPVHFARILAAATALAVGSCFSPHGPEPWMIAAWTAMLLLSMRLGAIRWRVEIYGDGAGPDMRALWRHSALPVLLPPLTALLAYETLFWRLEARELPFTLEIGEPGGPRLQELSADQLQNLIFLFAALIILALLLLWLDRKLRRRQAGTTELPGEIDTTVHEYEQSHAPEVPPELLAEEGPRGRILRAFRDFSAGLDALGLARREGETAEQFAARLSETHARLDFLGEEAVPLFNEACYGVREFSEEEASAFERALADAARVLRPGE